MAAGSGSNPTFDREFLDGLSRFQIRNGLRVSGFVDQRTLAALNVTANERLQQLETNLKRVQGLMSFNKAPRYVLVNVPFFVAQGVQNGELSFDSNVVAGKPARATPQVSAKIVEINFFPTWSVPEIVAQQDLIPKIRKDPSYFSQEHFTVMRDWKCAAARSGFSRLELAAGGELQVPPGARHLQRARRRAHQHAQQVQRLYARHAAQAAVRPERARLLLRLRAGGKGAGARRLAARAQNGWTLERCKAQIDSGKKLDVKLARPGAGAFRLSDGVCHAPPASPSSGPTSMAATLGDGADDPHDAVVAQQSAASRHRHSRSIEFGE